MTIVHLGRVEEQRAIVATALHDGHETRSSLAGQFALSPAERLREEDPYTGEWATVAPTYLVATRSRFEFDLNRPRNRAVYLEPDDAWGLDVWKTPLTPAQLEESLGCYDRFYEMARVELERVSSLYERFVVLDLHTYNHRRRGPAKPPAAPDLNPEVNIGTGSMDRVRWASVVDALIGTLRKHGFDVRENVKFRGGHFADWVHRLFPANGCCIAIEFKKTFMDEWTGELDQSRHQAIRAALAATLDPLERALDTCRTIA